MTVFAVALQVFLLTHSSLAVGGVGLASALPAIVSGLLAGSIVDAVDRRRLVLFTSSAQLVLSLALAAQAFAELDRVDLLYVLVGLQSLVASVNAPARSTFMPRLLPPDQLPAGAALGMVAMHAGLIVGPSLAGVVAAAGGLRLCYLIDAVELPRFAVRRRPACRRCVRMAGPPAPGCGRSPTGCVSSGAAGC